MNLTRLKDILPKEVYDQLYEFGAEFGLNTDHRLAMFLANCKHESYNFSKYEENLNYSAEALAKTWPTKFSQNPKATDKVPNKLALKIARRPDLIGAYAYGGRMGNQSFTGLNNARESEGYKYRGRGATQLTGKNNYKAFGDSIGIDLIANPELVATKYPITSALFFWHSNGLFVYCDTHTVKEVRKRVQGGALGLAEVEKYYAKYMDIL